MIKILAIDDKADNLCSISALLKTFIPDCSVVTADTGLEGIEKAKAELPDTILLDVKMPVMDGFEVCKKLKSDEKTKFIPVIMITAIKTDSKSRVQGLEIGADAFLHKPIDAAELTAQVNVMLRIKKAEDILRNEKKNLEIKVNERTLDLIKKNDQLKQEIKNRIKLEQQLIQFEKMKAIGQLAGGIAHDFNNLLMALFGNISMAKEKLTKDHPGFNFLKKAEQALDMSTRLTSQLLTFAKGGDPVKNDISIEDLVEDVINFDLSGSNVKPVFKHAKDLWIINADKGQMQQVFSNLTTNSKQAMPDGGHLFITSENENIVNDDLASHLKQGKYIKITFKDEGIGIDTDHLSRIFDPYYTTKQTGSGLGLATVYSIITKHGGSISVDSKLGAGSTFTFYLPASESQQPLEAKQPEAEFFDKKQNYKILLMDDEKIIRDVMVKMLESVNFSVEAAADGEETIEKYKKSLDDGKPFDVIIMDLTIRGGMGGKETIKHILDIDPDAKAIIASGYADDPVMANYADYGFKDVAVKPYPQGELEKILRKILK